MSPLQAGFASAIITPPAGIEMGAWSLRVGPAEGVHDEQLVRALVLDDGRTAVALVSLDVCDIHAGLVQRIEDLVLAQTPLARSNILINCTHTHTSPQTGWDVGGAGLSLSVGHRAYLDAFPYYVAGAIRTAWLRRAPAAIGAGSATAHDASINRRDPSLPADPQVGVVRVDRADGRPLACLVNYSCHATAVGPHYMLWTADFPGYLVRAIEAAEPGCAGMFLQGAQGDTQPLDYYFGNAQPRFPDTWDGAERMGKSLAGPALAAFQQIKTTPAAEIRAAERTIMLPPRPIRWTADEAEAYLARLETTATPWERPGIPEDQPACMCAQRYPDTYRLFGARHEARFARNYPSAGVACRLHAVRVGDLLLTSDSGELFNVLGTEIKRRAPVQPAFHMSLTSGSIAYIPTRDAAEAVLGLPLEEFCDPVKYRQHYGATITTDVGPAAGELVVEEVLRLAGEVA